MPRGTSTTKAAGSRGRRSDRRRSGTGDVIGQITQLVSANQALRLENAELLAKNELLRTQLAEIGQALGKLTGTSRRGRRAAVPSAVVDQRPRRQRKPITNPEVLERRRQALVKARAVRAERLAAARAEGSEIGQES